MGDLPTGPALLALARDVLLNDLLPLLPPASRLDARLVANSMAIAEREAAAGERAVREIIRDLEDFYGDATLTHSVPTETLPRTAGEGNFERLTRFGHDLRAGAFDDSEPRDREARAILWRLTIARLRQANPRFLAANGLS